MRALAYDIGKNLRAPIAGMGLEKELLVHLRTGDTPASERAKFRRKPAHFLVTTPESLAVMLAQENYAVHLRDIAIRHRRRTAFLRRQQARRRPDDLARTIGTLATCGDSGDSELCRIGLSATAAPLDILAQFLVGTNRPCHIAEAQVEKKSIVEVFSPIRKHPYPPAGYTGARLYAELAELIRTRQSVLVFTNVRSAAEQIGLRLKELLPELSRPN